MMIQSSKVVLFDDEQCKMVGTNVVSPVAGDMLDGEFERGNGGSGSDANGDSAGRNVGCATGAKVDVSGSS